MSLIVQGSVFYGQQMEVARNCQHWRTLFPDAEIILAISASDLLEGPVPGPVSALIPARHVADNMHITAAFDLLKQSCTAIVIADAALPLPPIKIDTAELNHINLQIAAAKAGLGLASRSHVLRVRNDLIFTNAEFFDQYRAGCALARGDAAALTDRVLISNTYTLNPFAYERLPFHFSDWFHFGLTEDVRALWDVPPMALADATFFDRQPHPADALYRERHHRCRLAVEQHVTFGSASRHVPEARLDHVGDLRSRDRSLDYLCDNFVVCDLQAAGCVLPKYAAELTEAPRTVHCFTANDWRDLTEAASSDRPAIASRQAMRAVRPETLPFPRLYPAASLSTPGTASSPLEICAAGAEGVVSHGPYVALPRGQYVARVCTSVIDGPGTIILRVTSSGGKRFVAHAKLVVGERGWLPPEIDFDIVENIAPGVEIVVETFGLAAICIVGVEIARRLGPSLIERNRQEHRIVRHWLRRAWRWVRHRAIDRPAPQQRDDSVAQ